MSKVFKAVGNAVSSVVKGVVKAVTNVVKAVVNVVSSVVNMVLQPFMGLLGGMPSVPDAQSEADRQQGVLVQTQGSNVNIPVVYGYRKLAGTVAFAETGSTTNKYLYVAYVFSEGLVEGLREVFIDDWQLPVNLTGALNGGQVVDVNADRYNGRVRLQWWPGQYFNNVAQSPVGSTVKTGIFAEAPSFKDTMDFNGLAVLFARYEWKSEVGPDNVDNNPFSGNIPQVQVSMLGRRIASLLVDAETFTYDSAPVRYSTNPAEILLDYLRNPRYGKGLLNDDIDWNSWKRAARKCNQTVTYLSNQSITGPILTSNIVVDTGATIMSNVKTLLMGFRAYMPYVQGKYKLRIEDAGNEYDILSGAAVIYQTFTKDDIVGNVTYTGIDKSAKYTSMTVTYVDPDQKWSNQQVIYPESEEDRQFYINLDGGRENPGQATFPTLTNYAMAKDMARLLFNKSRRQETCSLTVTSKALELEPGDNIRIQSNILNFSTDPWRIISFKVNDDMTVELGCVRNPDDIYPYARVGEEDEVLPTYVPKGSIIYFPGASNSQLIGLIPPTNAVYPSEFIPETVNPGATDPTGSGGGGVGGGIVDAGPIPPVEEPPVPAPIPVPPVNNTPVDPPKPVEFSAVLTFVSTTLEKFDSNTSRFIVRFRQPSDALYTYSIIYWRLNAKSPWREEKVEFRGVAGSEISVIIGPLPNLGQYDYYARSFDNNGKASSKFLRGYFKAQQSLSGVAGSLVGAGAGIVETVTEGWTLPASDVPIDPWYDDEIGSLEIRPILSGGLPQATRRLRVNMTQLVYAFGSNRVNDGIEGLSVYYKYKTDEYYSVEHLIFPANAGVFTPVSWDLAGDFGARAYPTSALTSATAFQEYDFIVRLKYRDGTTAKKQIGPARGLVEKSATPPFAGFYDFPVFGNVEGASGSANNRDIPSGFSLPTLDPSKVYNTAQDIIPSVKIFAYPSESKLQFVFSPPANNKFRGYTIRFREIIAGSNPVYNEVEVGPATVNNQIFFTLQGNGYSHSTKYEWAIYARYWDNVGVVQKNANNCLYARASVPFGQAFSVDQVNLNYNFETKDTATVLGELTTAFPAPASLVAKRWIKKQVNKPINVTDSRVVQTAGRGVDVYRDTAGGQPRLNAWYQLEFQAPNNTFDNLVCYRRFNSASGLNRTTVGTLAKYYELGQWERVAIARADCGYNSSTGTYTVNIRGPLSFDLFDPKFQVSAGKTLYAEAFGAPPNKYPYKGATPFLENMYPYYGVGNGQLTFGGAEFVFVIDDDGEGAKGLRLTEFYTDMTGTTTTPGFKNEVDGIQTANIPRDQYVNISDYNGLDVAFNRNINQAISARAFDKLSGSDTFGRGVPTINTSTYLTWRFYLEQPVGFTVY